MPHVPRGTHDQELVTASLAMQMEQNHDSKDDRREQNLNDVIIEDLLIGSGGVEEIGFFLVRGFVRWDAIDAGQCGFF
jgi:hypothetical protein